MATFTWTGQADRVDSNWAFLLDDINDANNRVLPAEWFPAGRSIADRTLIQFGIGKRAGVVSNTVAISIGPSHLDGQDFLDEVEQGIQIRVWKNSNPSNVLVIDGIGDSTEYYFWGTGDPAVGALADTIASNDLVTFTFTYPVVQTTEIGLSPAWSAAVATTLAAVPQHEPAPNAYRLDVEWRM